jgi:hypothetical protein
MGAACFLAVILGLAFSPQGAGLPATYALAISF